MLRLKEINSVVTNNFSDDSLNKIIKLWDEAKNSLDFTKNIYAVYHNYVSNYKGDYTLSITYEDSNGTIIIDNDNYKVYEVVGNSPEEIYKTWQQIWQDEEENKINRAYTYDYEFYASDGIFKIYIALV